MSASVSIELFLSTDQAATLAEKVSEAADLYAREVETANDFAHWKLDFELWRDATWNLVAEYLGVTLVNLYKPVGRVDAVAEIGWAYNPEHQRFLAILQIYLERIRYIVEKYSA